MTYKLKSLNVRLWPYSAMLVRDGSNHSVNKAELDAQVVSGDYLSLLATRLDQISQSLKKSSQSDYLILENTIDDLLYLQEKYQFTKK